MPYEVGGAHPFQGHRRVVASAPPEEEELHASGRSFGTGARKHGEQPSRVSEQERASAQEQMQAAAAAVAIVAAAAEAAAPKSEQPPEDFFDNVFDCLIMEDPVFAMDGFTYERRRIEEWLASNSRFALQPPTSHTLNLPRFRATSGRQQRGQSWSAKLSCRTTCCAAAF